MKKFCITTFSILFTISISCTSSSVVMDVKQNSDTHKNDTNNQNNVKKIKDGVCRNLWPDNSLKSVGTVQNYLKINKWTYYFQGSGGKILMAEGEYKKGKKNGEWVEYYKSGKLKSKIKYIDGIITGPRLYYYKSGMVHKEVWYRNGMKNGKSQEYFMDGKPKEIVWYKNDKKDGQSNLYYPHGKKKAIGKYQSGKKNGRWKLYNPEGYLEAVGKYADNIKVGKWVFYDNTRRKIDEKDYGR